MFGEQFLSTEKKVDYLPVAISRARGPRTFASVGMASMIITPPTKTPGPDIIFSKKNLPPSHRQLERKCAARLGELAGVARFCGLRFLQHRRRIEYV